MDFLSHFSSMTIHSLLKPTSSFLFILFLQHIKITISKSSYNPTEIILIDCGSSGKHPTPDGRIWTGDLNSKFDPKDQSNTTKSVPATANRQGSSVAPVPYLTARISQSKFTYTFPVTTGKKFVRLFFYPSSYEGGFNKSKDSFDVKTGPFTLLKNFTASVYASASKQESFIKEFCLNVEKNQQLSLTFSASPNSYAFINGIEILSMPTYLYHTPPQTEGLQFMGKTERFYVGNGTALERIYRFNVGGATISSLNDSGNMYRLWEYDIISDSIGSNNEELGDSLNYSRIPDYVAPDAVYLTARQMKEDDTNLTWVLQVDKGFKYLVRLHFCEFVTEIKIKINDRRFNIFLDNQTANLGFDVIESSGGVLTPIYNDYIVETGKNMGEVADDYSLLITLTPNFSSVYNDSFLNGLEVFKLNDSNGNLAGPNPLAPVIPKTNVPPSGQPSTAISKKSNTRKILLFAFGVGGGLIIISSLGCLVAWRLRMTRKHRYGAYYKSVSCCWWSKSGEGKSSRTIASSLPKELCRHFSLEELKEATNNFDGSLVIGSGGFGNVYRGNFDDGATILAIKRLNRESRQGAREFKTEIEMLSQLRHVNLVSLIGYCIEGGEMILLYDYMSNGTLREHLYEHKKKPLGWKQRLEICIGAARGIHYLHAGASQTVIHRDIKSTNILLDENWVAKVSDFGLSKVGVNNIAVSTLVKGTWGYLDPEYVRRNQLTEKSDVYSFGVVLFEVLCARKALNRKLDEEEVNLVAWARKCIENGSIHQIIDPELVGKISPKCFNNFVEIAENCVRDQSIERPSMHDVMEKLEFALELQQAADAEMEKKNPDGQYSYPQVSFHPSRYANVFGGSEIDSSNASGLMDLSSTDTDYTSTGRTFPSLMSCSLTSSHGFSDTVNSSSN